MTTAEEVVAATVRAFDEALHRAGFQQIGNPSGAITEWEWEGDAASPNGPTRVSIALTERFPFAAPHVRLLKYDSATSWHVEPDGNLCLWAAEERGALPWLDPHRLLGRIEGWLGHDAEGWTDDDPALDLEAYYEPDPLFATVILDWELAKDRLLLFRLTSAGVLHLERREFTRRRLRKRLQGPDSAFEGVGIDVGRPDTPRLTWSQLQRGLGPRHSHVDQALREKRPVIVVVRYTRGAHTGLMALTARVEQGEVRLRSLTLADAGERIRALRGGPDRAELQRRSVAIVGVGAVGSFLAEQLARSGVGELRLIDSDLLRPGNCIRHLCSPEDAGLPKTTAVRRHIEHRQLPGELSVAEGRGLQTLAEAVELLDAHDLVVDATADTAVQQMLLAAHTITGGAPFVSVALEGHGQFARADIIPSPTGAEQLPRGGVTAVASALREGGCGDPVSPTPPAAVVEAASIGARQAIAVLLGRATGSGERRALGWQS